jgi:hypothetical protein
MWMLTSGRFELSPRRHGSVDASEASGVVLALVLEQPTAATSASKPTDAERFFMD